MYVKMSVLAEAMSRFATVTTNSSDQAHGAETTAGLFDSLSMFTLALVVILGSCRVSVLP